jgi:hypothetical protein
LFGIKPEVMARPCRFSGKAVRFFARRWLIQRIPGLLGRPHFPFPESLPKVAEEDAPYRIRR